MTYTIVAYHDLQRLRHMENILLKKAYSIASDLSLKLSQFPKPYTW